MTYDPTCDEPPRPNPGFTVLVHPLPGTGPAIDVTHAVMDVYNIAVNSMDMGSGFLSTEEVGNLRVLGEAIGAERFDYQHDKCLRCGNDYERHYRLVRGGDFCIPDLCSGYVTGVVYR